MVVLAGFFALWEALLWFEGRVGPLSPFPVGFCMGFFFFFLLAWALFFFFFSSLLFLRFCKQVRHCNERAHLFFLFSFKIVSTTTAGITFKSYRHMHTYTHSHKVVFWGGFLHKRRRYNRLSWAKGFKLAIGLSVPQERVKE